MPGGRRARARRLAPRILNLELFNLRPQVAHPQTAPTMPALAFGYAAAYAAAALRSRSLRSNAGSSRRKPREADRRNWRTILLALLVAAASGTAGGVPGELCDAGAARPEPLGELTYYPSGAWLQQSAMGDATAWSDLLWLRAVQYYGMHRQTDNTFVQMAHVFDIITTLDPHFQSAYVFGGTSLCQEAHQFERVCCSRRAAATMAGVDHLFEPPVHYLGKRNPGARRSTSPRPRASPIRRTIASAGARSASVWLRTVCSNLAPGRGRPRTRCCATAIKTCASSRRGRPRSARSASARSLPPLQGGVSDKIQPWGDS
jgi:hypothetical protein